MKFQVKKHWAKVKSDIRVNNLKTSKTETRWTQETQNHRTSSTELENAIANTVQSSCKRDKKKI